MLAVYFMKEMGENACSFYLVPAVVIWGLFYYSGVHSAISGVAMAMLIPMTPRYSKEYFAHKMRHLKELMLAARTSGDDFPNEHHRFYMRRMRLLAADSVGMSYRLEHSLAPYVTFLVMPIFALANAGVEITSPEYLNIFHYSSEIGSIGMGIFFGLVVGKPLGIFLASWGAVKSGLAVMPEGATWRLLLAVACLGGIGFTMSLFVDALAYTEPDLIDRGKIAILMGSTAAAVLGSLLILVFFEETEINNMRKTFFALTAMALLAGACSRKSGGGRETQGRHRFGSLYHRYERGHEPAQKWIRRSTSMPYARVSATCSVPGAKLSADDAEVYYLRYMNYVLPEKARAYEEQFLADFAKSNRSYARTPSGVTYAVEVLGDQEQIPVSDRDSVALRYIIRTADGADVYSSYERRDTLRTSLGSLNKGMKESVKLIGKGGKINAWMPSAVAYGSAGGQKSSGSGPMPRFITKSSLSISTNIRIGRGAIIYAGNLGRYRNYFITLRG